MGTTLAVRRLRDAVEGAEAPCARAQCEALLARYRPGIHVLCARVAGGDRALAERLASEALERVLRALPGLCDASGARTGPRILDLARRVAFEAVRQPGELLLQDGVVLSPRLLDVSWNERSWVVRRALARLDPAPRAAGSLRYVDNLPWRAVDGWLGSAEPARRLAAERARLASEIGRLLA